MAEAFPSAGTSTQTFPFLLADLHRHGATGSLKVEGPSYQKALYFRGGRVLFGSSNDPRDQLGAILIESGKITPEQLEDVNPRSGPATRWPRSSRRAASSTSASSPRPHGSRSSASSPT